MSLNNELPILPPAFPLSKQTNDQPWRVRLTHEKYFRQALKVWNNQQQYVDSGYVQINDYTNMCRMVKVLDKSAPCHHICQQWVYYGEQYYTTDFFDIYDFINGRLIATIKQECFDVQQYTAALQTIWPNICVLIGDLSVDTKSIALLDAIEKHSNKNAPVRNIIRKQTGVLCDCRLIERLDINDKLYRDQINSEQYSQLINDLDCICEPIGNPVAPEQQAEYDAAFANYISLFAEKL